MTKTNLQCVNSDSVGYYCIALNEIHKKCLTGDCPFYKTDYQFKVSEARAKRHCDSLGLVFKTRAEVILEMNKNSKLYAKYGKRPKPASIKVIQYNSRENVFIEHDSVESVAEYLGITKEKVEGLIKYKKTYKGHEFVFA